MIKYSAMGMASVLYLLISGNAQAQIAAPDAQKGHELAERLCAACHAVTPGSTSGRPDLSDLSARSSFRIRLCPASP
jgi:cytochrome c2